MDLEKLRGRRQSRTGCDGVNSQAMAGLRYLTVQDMLWIHHQVVGDVQPFDYAKLEEATYCQYGQAARFLTGFAKMAPFPSGNEAAAFVGFVAFLRANGYDLDASDSQAASMPFADLGQRVEPWLGEEHSEPGIRGMVADVLSEFPKTVGQLLGKTPAAA
jgi:hypothetical protein